MSDTVLTRLPGDVVVYVDGGDTFVVPMPHRTVVTILAEDLADAMRDRDGVRYEADLRGLQRTVATFGRPTDRYHVPDIVLPPGDSDLAAARRVVRVTTPRGPSGLSWPAVLLFTPQLPGGLSR